MSSTTTIVVVYRTPSLDLSYLDPDSPAIVVHNDSSLEPQGVTHPTTRHIVAGDNIGFGAAVNRALEFVQTERVLLVNPDVSMDRTAWRAVAEGASHEVTTIPLLDSTGVPTSVVAPYPSPWSLSLTSWRAGRLVNRRLRRRLPRGLLGPWVREQVRLLEASDAVLPLSTHWVSGAVLGIDVGRLRAVGGFDERYFLYLEDVDLGARLATRYPDMHVRVVPVSAMHQVSASSVDPTQRRTTDRHYAQSALAYASRFPGWKGGATRAVIRLRQASLR